MIGHDYSYHRRRQRQRERAQRMAELAMTGLLIGAMAAIGAVTILGLFGAL